VTDIVSISSIVEKFPNTQVRFLPSLHAKIYVADDTKAVVTSANMTDSGLMRNFEYGVLFSDISTVQSIKEDVLSYASVGSAVDLFQLRKFTEITLELRDIRRLAEKNLKSKLNKEFKRRVEKAEEEFIRVRVGGQHLHTIFSQTIKYILNSGSASTIQLHQTIQRIHPDLCDDNIDRIIDGKHFGKKWKHAVRTAQQHLKKRGEIELLNGYWRLC